MTKIGEILNCCCIISLDRTITEKLKREKKFIELERIIEENRDNGIDDVTVFSPIYAVSARISNQEVLYQLIEKGYVIEKQNIYRALIDTY